MSDLEVQLKDFSNSTDDINLEESSEKIGTDLYPKISGDPALLKTMQDIGEDAKKFDSTLTEGRIATDDTARMLHDSAKLVKSIDEVLEKNGNNLDEGTALVLKGAIATLNDINVILNKTDNLYKNKKVIADIVADEWQRLDDELGLLDINTKAKKISFTSYKNDSPRSLQVVLRSQEISLEEKEIVSNDDKKPTEQILDRIKMIFNKIGETFIEWGRKL
jgi:putative membrane protein